MMKTTCFTHTSTSSMPHSPSLATPPTSLCASRGNSPPGSGQPVPGTNAASRESMSSDSLICTRTDPERGAVTWAVCNGVFHGVHQSISTIVRAQYPGDKERHVRSLLVHYTGKEKAHPSLSSLMSRKHEGFKNRRLARQHTVRKSTRTRASSGSDPTHRTSRRRRIHPKQLREPSRSPCPYRSPQGPAHSKPGGRLTPHLSWTEQIRAQDILLWNRSKGDGAIISNFPVTATSICI